MAPEATTVEPEANGAAAHEENGAGPLVMDPKGRVTPKRGRAAEPAPTIQPLHIAKPDRAFFSIQVHGLSALITHRLGDTARNKMIADQTKPKTARAKRDLRDPEKEFREACYMVAKGVYGVPASGFASAMVSACRFVDDLPMTHARSLFYIKGEGPRGGLVRVLDAKGKPAQPVMDEDFVRVPPRTGTMMPCWRARFDEWYATLSFMINDVRLITVEAMVNLLDRAGTQIGICEGRPEKTGFRYQGMFEVCGKPKPVTWTR